MSGKPIMIRTGKINTLIFLILLFFAAITLASCEYFYRDAPEEQTFACGTCMRNNNVTYPQARALFMTNCASCHHPVNDATGPALHPIKYIRSADWLYKFLTDEKFKPRDQLSRELRAKFGSSCMKFPGLTRADVAALFDYR